MLKKVPPNGWVKIFSRQPDINENISINGNRMSMDEYLAPPAPSYYRGEQPLLKTFMLLGVVIAFFVQLFAFPLSKAVNNFIGVPWGLAFLFAVVLPYLWFASASIWRSAKQCRSLLAAIIAKTLVIFWVAPWVIAFFYEAWILTTTGA